MNIIILFVDELKLIHLEEEIGKKKKSFIFIIFLFDFILRRVNKNKNNQIILDYLKSDTCKLKGRKLCFMFASLCFYYVVVVYILFIFLLCCVFFVSRLF